MRIELKLLFTKLVVIIPHSHNSYVYCLSVLSRFHCIGIADKQQRPVSSVKLYLQ